MVPRRSLGHVVSKTNPLLSGLAPVMAPVSDRDRDSFSRSNAKAQSTRYGHPFQKRKGTLHHERQKSRGYRSEQNQMSISQSDSGQNRLAVASRAYQGAQRGRADVDDGRCLDAG